MSVTQTNDDRHGLAKPQIVEGLRKLGLRRGQVVFMHTAMRTMGHVQNGAGTVVDALLEVLGPSGTLVVPTFTFAHEAEDDPIVDPRIDESEMGVITQTICKHPDARRSIAYRHSFAAIGRRAEVITNVDPALSPFDLRASFGVMLALNTQVVLLGMTYANSTSHHFAEWVCDVPYRQSIAIKVRVRGPDGRVFEQPMIDYQPKSEGDSYYGSRHPDFNRLGRMLEERDLVGRTFIGNAAMRRFAMRDLIDLAQIEAEKDYNIFRTTEGDSDTTSLDFGRVVLSPSMKDGADRPVQYEWCVK